jgi:hypothetical protein
VVEGEALANPDEDNGWTVLATTVSAEGGADGPEFAVYRHLRTRDPCIDGVSLPKKFKIHRHMN